MRVSDRQLQIDYLRSMNLTKNRLSKLQEQVTTGKEINRPSDSPLGTSRLFKLSNQLGNITTFRNNIERAQTSLDMSISSMQGFQSEIQNVISDLTGLQNPTVGENNVRAYSDKLDLIISQLFDFANTDVDGQYLFGGTDDSVKPFALNSAGTAVQVNSQGIGGERKIRIAKNIDQKINMTGKEVFESVWKQSGTIDSSAAVGTSFSKTGKIDGADGTEYDFTITYTKTADNAYELSYSYDDGSGTVALTQTNDLTFNAATGELETVDGGNPSDIRINIPGNKIDFKIDVADLAESDSTSVKTRLNVKANIFNTLLDIKENLSNGQLPNQEQLAIINGFNTHILDKISSAGDIGRRLENTTQLLDGQELELKDLQSKERDVDIMKAMVELESQQFNLNLGYKISSMILPKSLMDFL
ncbi:MAG: flagellar hook-associated protein 3 [Chlorobi bacterium]|nr:flagellar hook-associated protein 3 [Chlorobiota bacterium]